MAKVLLRLAGYCCVLGGMDSQARDILPFYKALERPSFCSSVLGTSPGARAKTKIRSIEDLYYKELYLFSLEKRRRRGDMVNLCNYINGPY